MNFKINFENKENFKFLILIILYLFFFYFFIFKNFNLYFELKENINREEINIEKLSYEKFELEKILKNKRENIDKFNKKLEKIKDFQNDKKEFLNFSETFEYLNMLINKNNLYLDNIGRLNDNENFISINMKIYGDENDILKFLSDLEESEYSFKLSQSYFKMNKFNEFVSITFSALTKLKKDFEKIDISSERQEHIFIKKNTKNLSFFRIGNKKIYKSYKSLETLSNNKETKNKSTTLNNKKMEGEL